jgi:multidrug efflux pump subunit AcrA (membrane-fusion protein)
VLEPTDSVEFRIKPKVFQGELSIKSVVKPNSRVAKDDVLLELDDRVITKDVRTAENELEGAKANLAKAESDVDLLTKADQLARMVAENDLKNGETYLKWFDETDGPLAIQQADLQLKMAQYSLDDQNDELDQLKKMYKTEDLTSATADIVIKRAFRQVDISKINVGREEKENQKAKTLSVPQQRQKLASGVDQQRINLEQLKATQAQAAVTRKVAVAAAQRAVSDVEQKLSDLKADLAMFKQMAPVDGVIYYGQFTNRTWTGNEPRMFQPGEKIQPGTIVLTLVQPGRLRVAMDLPEWGYAAVKPGTDATVVPGVLGQKLAGRTLAPSPIARSTGLELQIQLPETPAVLVPGMKARVMIDAGKTDNVLLVPSSAVSANKVTLKQGGTKRVLVGRTVDDQTEIIDGLNEGDEIVKAAK